MSSKEEKVIFKCIGSYIPRKEHDDDGACDLRATSMDIIVKNNDDSLFYRIERKDINYGLFIKKCCGKSEKNSKIKMYEPGSGSRTDWRQQKYAGTD